MSRPEANPAVRSTQGSQMSMLRTFRAVAWSFVGIRKRSGYEEDLGKLNPFHVMVAAVLAVALFVGGLIALVHWIVSAGPGTT